VYLDAAKSANFPNFPSNTAKIYRIPRLAVIPANKTLTGLGATGCMVNGVSMFDMRDAFSYVSGSSTDATPVNGLTGDGVWNRDGYHNEGVTFDAALAHQAGNNYHYHAQPIGLRYWLGDHVDYNAVTNRYTESPAAVTHHSPILAWAADGLPVYGPYGYSSPLDPNSGLRRMVSGFVLRNGDYGTTNLTSTGRTTLPPWAIRIQTVTFKIGPAVSNAYLLGHYIEDFDYSTPGGSSAIAPGGSAARGSVVTVTITLPANPPNPPTNVIPLSITLAGTISGTSISRPSATTAQATFTIPANAPTGAQNVVVVFSPGPTYTLTGGFTIN